MNKLLSTWGYKSMLLLLLICGVTLNAQIDQQKYQIGTFQSLASQLGQSSKTGDEGKIDLTITGGKTVKGKINVSKIENQGEVFIGNISGDNKNTFYFTLKNGVLSGHSILRESLKAYTYSTENGKVYVQETDINKLLCVNYETNSKIDKVNINSSRTLSITDLQSFPGGAGCVLLDFDGQYVSGTPWNGGNPIDAQPSGMNDATIQAIFDIVSEDYRPFKMNVTTNEAVFNTYPKTMRMRVIFTPTNTAAPGSGGVAYIGSFSWNDDTPCWVFNQGVVGAGEAASHEVGHTLNLYHDGRTSPSEAYYQGQGSWAPIMGVGYYKTIVQWSKGEYTNANNTENDLAIISGVNFGVGYRNDDHSNSIAGATALQIGSGGAVSSSNNFGIIERTGDLDFFSFTTTGGTVTLNFTTVSGRPGNLDILAKLYNSSQSLLGSFDPTGLNSSLSTNLAAGTYYMSIDGTGSGNPLTDGYSDYASLGSFFISGTVPNSGNTPPTVSITSPANNAAFTAPANITINANASDANGTVSQVQFYQGTTLLGTDNTAPYSFSWNNVPAGTYSLTAKATDNQNAVTTSAAVNITVSGGNNCSGVPQYVENGGYVAGSKVQNVGNKYECKPWPYSGWCNGAAWAYGPGTGTYWTHAWTLVSACGAANASGAFTEITIESTGVQPLIFPNPSSGEFTILFGNPAETHQIKITDVNGKIIEAISVNNIDFYQMGNNLIAGIYFIEVSTATEAYVTKVIKY